MLTSKQLNELSLLPLELVFSNDVVNVTDISVDRKLPQTFRILRFIEESGNPYCFKVGDHYVRTRFASTGLTLQNALINSIRQE